MKNVFGSLAYIAEGLSIKRLNSMKPYKVKVEYDGNVIEDEFIYGMICNSMSVGGFKGLGGKDVLMNDGIMEGLFIKNPKNLIELHPVLARNPLMLKELLRLVLGEDYRETDFYLEQRAVDMILAEIG